LSTSRRFSPDSERRVVDILPDRSAVGTANWLKQHPEIETVSRDRCGLFAQGAREGAPGIVTLLN
jgi:transposase